MAIKEKRGWVWDLKEKDWINIWKGDLQIKYNYVSVQLERFNEMLPKHYEEALKSSNSFIRAAKSLLSLDGRFKGRKYNSMSLLEAKKRLNNAQKEFSVWKNFISRPDIQDDIKNINRNMKVGDQELQNYGRREDRFIQRVLHSIF